MKTSGCMPIKDTWEVRGWEVILLLLSADSLERIIPRNGCWGMHSPPEGNAAALEPSPNQSTLRAGKPHWVGVCRHPLTAGTAGAALAVEIFISTSRSSSSSPATANKTRLAFIATEATMEIREGMELAFCRRALGFFLHNLFIYGANSERL